jgi:hypothetical protein
MSGCQFELLNSAPDADGLYTIFCPQCTQAIRRRIPSTKTYRPCTSPIEKKNGVGTKLKEILSRFNIVFTADCKCREYMLIMNHWGIQGCQENYAVIIGWLRHEYKRLGWATQLSHAAKIRLNVDFQVDWNYPFESFLDEALHQATISSLPAQAAASLPQPAP